MLKSHLVALACSAALLTAPALAQDFFDHNGPDPAAIPSWPMTVPGKDLIVVVKAQPGKRHSCQLGSLTAEALTCVGQHGSKPVVYKPTDVEALISPRYHQHANLWALLPVTIGGAILYGAVLLNPITEAGAVAIGIVASVVILSGVFAAIIDDDEDTPDRLLYLAADQKLSVTLRK